MKLNLTSRTRNNRTQPSSSSSPWLLFLCFQIIFVLFQQHSWSPFLFFRTLFVQNLWATLNHSTAFIKIIIKIMPPQITDMMMDFSFPEHSSWTASTTYSKQISPSSVMIALPLHYFAHTNTSITTTSRGTK